MDPFQRVHPRARQVRFVARKQQLLYTNSQPIASDGGVFYLYARQSRGKAFDVSQPPKHGAAGSSLKRMSGELRMEE